MTTCPSSALLPGWWGHGDQTSAIHLPQLTAEEEVAHLQGELNAILAFVEQLSEVDVEGVEPMTSVTPMEMKKRPDEVTDGGIPDDIVRNAPATEDHFFLVPKVCLGNPHRDAPASQWMRPRQSVGARIVAVTRV